MNHLLSSPLDSNVSSKLALGDKASSSPNETPSKNSDGQQSSFTSFFQNEKESISSKSEILVSEKAANAPVPQPKNGNPQPETQRLEDSSKNLEAPLKVTENVKIKSDMDKKLEFPNRDAATSTTVRGREFVGVPLSPLGDKGLALFNASLMAAKAEMPFIPPAGRDVGVTENLLNIEMGSPMRQEVFREGVIKESRLQPHTSSASGVELPRVEKPEASLDPKVSTPNETVLITEVDADPDVATGVDDPKFPKAVNGQQSAQTQSTMDQLTPQQGTQSGEIRAQVSQVAQPRPLYQVDQAKLLNFIESEARVFIDSKNLTREIAIKVRPHNMGDMTITLQRNDVNQSVAVNIITANEKATNYLSLIKGEITKQINAHVSINMMPQGAPNQRLSTAKPVKFENYSTTQDVENDSEINLFKKNTIKSV